MDSPFVPGVVQAIGALSVFGLLCKLGGVVWTYARPSKLARYLHVSSTGQPAWALVTGSSSGIGLEFATQLAGRGFNVALHGIDEAELERARACLSAAHPARQFRIFMADAAKAHTAQGQASLAAVAAELAQLNLTVVVDNVGGPRGASAGDMETLFRSYWARGAGDIMEEISINCLWNALLLNALLPTLMGNAPALVVDIGSMADVGPPLLISYGSAKAFKRTSSTGLAREVMLAGKDVDIVHMRLGTTTGTAMVNLAPSLFVPAKEQVVRAALERVGGGSYVVTPYFPHALQLWALESLPSFLQHWLLVMSMRVAREKAPALARTLKQSGAGNGKED